MRGRVIVLLVINLKPAAMDQIPVGPVSRRKTIPQILRTKAIVLTQQLKLYAQKTVLSHLITRMASVTKFLAAHLVRITVILGRRAWVIRTVGVLILLVGQTRVRRFSPSQLPPPPQLLPPQPG